jgi:transposase InsO family protein
MISERNSQSLARFRVCQELADAFTELRSVRNARMESFFATLKKEKLYKINTELLPMSTVKSIIFRWIFSYYNRHRIYSANDGGYPPSVKRDMFFVFQNAA